MMIGIAAAISITRAMMSIWPPAGKPTIKRTGRVA
jgi:hypothetical protein